MNSLMKPLLCLDFIKPIGTDYKAIALSILLIDTLETLADELSIVKSLLCKGSTILIVPINSTGARPSGKR